MSRSHSVSQCEWLGVCMGVGNDWHIGFLVPGDIAGQVKNNVPLSHSPGRTGPGLVYT